MKEQDFYESVSVDMDDNAATMALYQLSDYLSRYYGKKVLILLDEYDTPFGFTEAEVKQALCLFDMEDSFDEVKQWYDGFCFGKQRDIYNPWSITKYLDTKELKSYWANTSSNQLIAKLLQQGNSDMKVVMEDLLHRKQIEEVLDEEIVFEQLDENENAIKSLYWSKGKTLKKIMWCDDEKIKPYFIVAGKNLTYGNLRRQLTDSLEDKPLPKLSEELQKHTFWEFGSKEEHFKYRNVVMRPIYTVIFRFLKDSTICSIRFGSRKDLRECWKRLL